MPTSQHDVVQQQALVLRPEQRPKFMTIHTADACKLP